MTQGEAEAAAREIVGEMTGERQRNEKNNDIEKRALQTNEEGDIILKGKRFDNIEKIIESDFEDLPRESLDNLTAREWYYNKVVDIPDVYKRQAVSVGMAELGDHEKLLSWDFTADRKDTKPDICQQALCHGDDVYDEDGVSQDAL